MAKSDDEHLQFQCHLATHFEETLYDGNNIKAEIIDTLSWCTRIQLSLYVLMYVHSNYRIAQNFDRGTFDSFQLDHQYLTRQIV